MVQGREFSREWIHEELWKRANRRGKVELHLGTAAEELGISYWHFTKIVKQLETAGCLKKISQRKGNIGIYSIKQPSSLPNQDQ